MKRGAIVTGLGLAAFLCADAPAAAASLDGRSLRFSAGVALPEEIGAAPWLAAGVTFHLGKIAVEPELGFWFESETAFGLQASASDLHAGASLAWAPLAGGRTRLLLGAGGAAHMLRRANGPAARDTASETSLQPGVQAFAAIERRLSARTAIFVAARLDLVFRGQADDELQQRYYGGLRIAF